MGEYIGKIDILKEDMLFVTNTLFSKEIKETTTKENILKIIPELYVEENYEKLIRMLPYDAYKGLEELIKYLKKNDDIEKFLRDREYYCERYLIEAMIIIRRVKRGKYIYSLNPGAIENLTGMFIGKYKRLAERYGRIEKLTLGMLYTYGVVEINFLREQLCKYMSAIITPKELEDLYFERLNLNYIIDNFGINWTNNNTINDFVTYLQEYETDAADIATEQKKRGLNYKKFTEKQILEREEYLWNDRNKKLYEYIRSKSRGNQVWEFAFKRLLKRAELGERIFDELANMCHFINDEEMEEFAQVIMEWNNNTSQYVLGGYTPNELFQKYIKK